MRPSSPPRLPRRKSTAGPGALLLLLFLLLLLAPAPNARAQGLPELSASVEWAQTRADADDAVHIERTLTNSGAAAGLVTLHYLLSDDATIDSSDRMIGSESVTAVQGVTTDAVRLRIPVGTTGARFIGVIVDPADQIMESDETNNRAASPTALAIGSAPYQRELLPRSYSSIVGSSGAVVHFDGDRNTPPRIGNTTFVQTPLPFSFPFFGQPRSDIRIHIDGCLSFELTEGRHVAGQFGAIPAFLGPTGMIAPLWSDLEIRHGTLTQVVSRVTGAPGTRVLVIEWSRLTQEGVAGTSLSFQAVLHEADASIEFRYPDPATQLTALGFEYTAGIENDARTEAYGALNLRAGNTTPPGRNIRFLATPPTAPDLQVVIRNHRRRTQTHCSQADSFELEVRVINAGLATTAAVPLALHASPDYPVDTTDPALTTLDLGIVGTHEIRDLRVQVDVAPQFPSGTFNTAWFIDPGDAISESNELNNHVEVRALTIGNAAYTREVFPIAGYTSIVGAPGTTVHADGDPSTPVLPLGFHAGLVVSLPFPFEFFGTPRTQVLLTGQGCMGFDPARPASLYANPDPLGANSGGLVTPLWAELNVFRDTPSVLATAVEGVPGRRIFTVEWHRLRAGTTGPQDLSFQVKLFEADDRIELHYPEPATQTMGGMIYAAGIESDNGQETYGAVDLDNDHTEIPTRNVRFRPSSFPGVELTVVGATTPVTLVPPGANGAVRVELQNLGRDDADSFELVLRLSTDATIDATDPIIATHALTGLTAGDSLTLDLVGPLPATTPLGPAFLAVELDPARALTETSRSNNISDALPISVATARTLAELEIQPFTLPTTTLRLGASAAASPPGIVPLSFSITNSGALPAFQVRHGVRLSTDTRFDSGDAYVTDVISHSVGQGATVTESLSLELDDNLGLEAGTWFLSIITDVSDDILESDESNNVAPPLAITLLPTALIDLLPTAITVTPPRIAPGGAVAIERRIANIGSTDFTGSIDVVVRLSPDRDINSGDLELGRRTETLTIPAGAELGPSPFAVTLPSTVFESVYYIGLELTNFPADANTANDDHGDPQDNPNFPAPLTVAGASTTIDELRPFGRSTLDRRTALPGEVITVQTPAIGNLGTRAQSAIDVGVYVSDAPSFPDPGFRFDRQTATRVGAFTVPALAAGATESGRSVSFVVPELAPGTYAAGIFVDDSDQIFESDEQNNGACEAPESFVLGLRPFGTDLTVSLFELGATVATPGSSLAFTRILTNLRAHPSPAFRTRIVLSDDSVIDPGDATLVASTLPAGLLGFDGPTTVSVTIPPATPAGTWFVGIIADDIDAVAEADETNNQATAMIQIQIFSPCDVDQDGAVTVTDIQQAINVALGLQAANGREDLDGNGAVDVRDVQALIDAALGGPCP